MSRKEDNKPLEINMINPYAAGGSILTNATSATDRTPEKKARVPAKKFTNPSIPSLEVKVNVVSEGEDDSTDKKTKNELVSFEFFTLRFTNPKLELEYSYDHVKRYVGMTRWILIVVLIAIIAFMVVAYTGTTHPRYPEGSIGTRITLIVLDVGLLAFTYTPYYFEMYVRYPFFLVVWILMIMVGLTLSRVLDNDSFSSGSMIAVQLLLQSGVCLSSGIQWSILIWIVTIELIYFICCVLIFSEMIHQASDVPHEFVLIYALLGSLMYFWVCRGLDFSSRTTFILTQRLKKEKVDLNFQLEGIKLFDAADKVGRTRALDVVIDPSTITLEESLGSGSFGEVRKGTWQRTTVAVKTINGNAVENKKILVKFHEESSIMSKLRHPNVVQFLGVCIHPPMLLMEFMQRGSLYDIVQNKKMDLHWTLIIQIAMDAANGMNFLHLNKPPIIHKDLKSRNLLVSGDWHVKVSDFGLSSLKNRVSVVTASGKGSNVEESKCELGTIPWTAPELFAERENSEKTDVYSYGIILYELLTREIPWKGTPNTAIPHLVETGKRPGGDNPVIVSESILKEVLKVMYKCWEQRPEDRPNFDQICATLEKIVSGHVKSVGGGSWNEMIVYPGTATVTTPRAGSIVALETSKDNARADKEPAAIMSFNIDVKDIILGPKIGKGSYAVVYEGKYSGTHVAVKEILFEHSTEDVIKEFNKECELMLKFRHPNIVLFMGNCVTPSKLYMVTELLIRGSVHQMYKSGKAGDSGRSAVDLCLSIGADGARGIQYLHGLSPPLIHRDLKSPNVLLDENYVAKIGDFGLSRFKDDSKTMTMVGSPLWVAPEVLRGERFGEPCDVYSFAIILWELLALEEPYPGLSSSAVMRGVASGKLRPERKKIIPSPVWDLLNLMWAPDAKARPLISQVLTSLEKMKVSLNRKDAAIVSV
jgi:serine/threonine protein kinase